jgi:hypothetical protein
MKYSSQFVETLVKEIKLAKECIKAYGEITSLTTDCNGNYVVFDNEGYFSSNLTKEQYEYIKQVLKDNDK